MSFSSYPNPISTRYLYFTNMLCNLPNITKQVVESEVKFKLDSPASSLLAPLHCYWGPKKNGMFNWEFQWRVRPKTDIKFMSHQGTD